MRDQSDASGQPAIHLRGGAVLWRGGAILLPGRRGAGTSQLVAAFVRAGARPLADGEVALDDAGRVLVVDAAAGQEPEAFDVALILAAIQKMGAEWQPEERRCAQAVVPLLDRAIAGGSASPRRLLQVAARLAARVTALAGSRPEADRVAPEILAYLDRLHDYRCA